MGRVPRIVGDLAHLEQHGSARMRCSIEPIFAPDYRPNEIRPKAKRKKGEWFAHGELMRLVLETLRKARDPMTAKETTLALMSMECGRSRGGLGRTTFSLRPAKQAC
jgi:hypothetical protein